MIKLDTDVSVTATGIDMMTSSKYVERIDPLTGCANLLAFLESFSARLKSGTNTAFSLLLIDVNHFMAFNAQYGHARGDAVLHWISIVLHDTGLPVYRIGDDEFLLLFEEGKSEACHATCQSVFERLNRESQQFDLAHPASVILIHFQNEALQIADLWMAISDALFDAKVYGEQKLLVNSYTHASAINNYQLRVINMLTERLLSFATRLEDTHQLAYLDPVTQLPNNLAAEMEMNRAIEQSSLSDTQFSILFIDGDNLRLYNDISYSAGDKMLQRLSNLLARHLRPGDFLARWRVGDEFLVILPATDSEQAWFVAERLRAAVEAGTKTWEIPVTISVGIATYPTNGHAQDDLLDAVERANKLSKDSGKNRVTAW